MVHKTTILNTEIQTIYDSNSTNNPSISAETNGRIGIGVVNPTAKLHIAASTTAAALMRLEVGAAPTSPNDGDIWLESNMKSKIIYDKNRKRPFDVNKLVCDNSKAKKILKWKPTISLEDGLKQTLIWAKNNNITLNNCAIGDKIEEKIFNVNNKTKSSSFLKLNKNKI